jgi:AraC-like DNA-binding protein
MKSKNVDTLVQFPGIAIIHQKIPSHETGRHFHAEHEFFMPLHGDITVQFADLTVKAGPGRILYVPPNLDHSFSSTAQGSGERLIWLIEQRLWKQHTKEKFTATSMPMNSLAKELLFFLLVHQKAQGAKYFISALTESLVESLNSERMKGGPLFSEHLAGKVLDERVKKSMQMIDENLADLSLAEVARKSGLSSRNFNRLFIKETGLSPKEYLILRRIEKAKRLLKETKMTVTDISLEVGYNSLSKFIGTFKKIEGQLPSDFRGPALERFRV